MNGEQQEAIDAARFPDRVRRLERLDDHYGLRHRFDVDESKRYLAVYEEDPGVTGECYGDSADTPEEAFGMLGDGVLDGYAPVAAFDLDTGEMVAVHVSTPVITRAEENAMENPLEDPHEPAFTP